MSSYHGEKMYYRMLSENKVLENGKSLIFIISLVGWKLEVYVNKKYKWREF